MCKPQCLLITVKSETSERRREPHEALNFLSSLTKVITFHTLKFCQQPGNRFQCWQQLQEGKDSLLALGKTNILGLKELKEYILSHLKARCWAQFPLDVFGVFYF